MWYRQLYTEFQKVHMHEQGITDGDVTKLKPFTGSKDVVINNGKGAMETWRLHIVNGSSDCAVELISSEEIPMHPQQSMANILYRQVQRENYYHPFLKWFLKKELADLFQGDYDQVEAGEVHEVLNSLIMLAKIFRPAYTEDIKTLGFIIEFLEKWECDLIAKQPALDQVKQS